CNNNLLDTYQLKLQNAVLDAEVREIRREGNQYAVTLAYTHAHSEVETLLYDRVITCTGFRFDHSIFGAGCQPELRSCGRLPAMTSEWESKNIPGLFFAGTIMQYRDYKKYMSAFIHGYRYNVQTLSRMLEQRYHDTPWPSRAVARSAPELMEALLARANKSSALWQQPGFLCDALQLDASPSSAEYYEELPVDYVRESRFGSGRWLMLTLEFGMVKGDPFSIERIHRTDAQHASESVFLHPIVRYSSDGQLVAEHHVIEDLAAVWDESEHRDPLAEFVSEVLSGRIAFGRGAAAVRASGLYSTDGTGAAGAEPALAAREAAR
ncbi:MAG TPA: NAD(P)-binding domain-containing protein, partial [Polyangiaceae bacterium]|nr:NAD(P)-binding domain-containing protein [Polyangiaceae bacterium]